MNVRGLCTKYGICTHDYYECACLKINIFSVDQVEYTKNSILTSKNKLPMRMNNKDIDLFMYIQNMYVLQTCHAPFAAVVFFRTLRLHLEIAMMMMTANPRRKISATKRSPSKNPWILTLIEQ